MIPGRYDSSWRRNTDRAACGHIWKKGLTYGAFASASFPGMNTMNDLRSTDTTGAERFGQASSRDLTRAERMDVVFSLAAAGCGEWSGEVILMLERVHAEEDPTSDGTKF